MASNGVSSDVGPYTIVPFWVYEVGLSTRAIQLYGVMGTYANKDGNGAYPRRRTLAKRMGVNSLRTVDAALAELREAGALEWENDERDDGGQTANRYRVIHSDPRVVQGGPQKPASQGEQFFAHHELDPEEPNTSTSNEVLVPDVADAAPAVTKVEGRNLPFDALVEVCNVDLRNKTQRGRLGKALKDIRGYFWEEVRDVAFDLAPEEYEAALARAVKARANEYRGRFPKVVLTPTALSTWWHQMVRPSAGRRVLTDADRDRIRTGPNLIKELDKRFKEGGNDAS